MPSRKKLPTDLTSDLSAGLPAGLTGKRADRRRWSRLVAAASAGYGVFALVKPDHLATGLEAEDSTAWRTLARVFGAREIAVGALALRGDAGVVSACMAARLTFDLSDCAILLGEIEDESVRRKVLGVTLGWAAVNALAVAADRASNR